jgi:hypothetical protein
MLKYFEYIPIITTVFSLYFTVEIYKHYKRRNTKYLLWWTLGVITFGLGTLTESINILVGFSEINLKSWYVVGALLGGFPLAQGTVYLLMKKKFANISTIIFVSLIAIASILVFLSPIDIPENFDNRLSGSVLEWSWVRLFSPLINIYALIFLVGGAIYSANRYFRLGERNALFMGNIYIAVGGLLPGIGGTFTRMGYVEMLFITELIGLLFIYFGYKIIKTEKNK